MSLLLNAKEVYEEIYQASAISLPFLDNTFNIVCSFDVTGHIPLNVKMMF